MTSAAGSRAGSTWAQSSLVQRASVAPELAIAIPAAAISAALLIGMGFGVGPLTTAASVVAFGAAVVSPPTGLLIIAFMGPLKPPDTIPAPGFDLLLVGATVLGCIYRLPIDRPRMRVPASF